MNRIRVRNALPQANVLYVWRNVTANATMSAVTDSVRAPVDTIGDDGLYRAL